MHIWTLRYVALAGLLFVVTQSLAALPLMEGLYVGLLICLVGGAAVHGGEALSHAWRARRATLSRGPASRPPLPSPDA
ncbi:MAG: hypothetical protein AAFN13_14065 [Bacteroidota bacterium]